MAIWKEINGYEGLYKVSDEGKVMSMDRLIYNNGNHTYNKVKGKELKILRSGNYYYVHLYKDKMCKNYYIHRLVAMAFIPNPNNYDYINHKDENPSNNNIDNLEWCTASYNCNYGNHNQKMRASKTGTHRVYLTNGKFKYIK